MAHRPEQEAGVRRGPAAAGLTAVPSPAVSPLPFPVLYCLVTRGNNIHRTLPVTQRSGRDGGRREVRGLAQLTQMELLQVHELLRAEELAWRKCSHYAEHAQDPQVKQMSQYCSQRHRQHMQTLLGQLQSMS